MKKAVFAFIVLLLVGCAAVQQTSQKIEPEQSINQTVQENISETAVKGTKILLIECVGTPNRLEIQEGEMLTFENADVREHKIEIADKELIVPNEGSTEIKAKFFGGKRAYRYSCDNKENIGTVVVN